MPEQKRPRGSSSRSTGGRPRGSSSRTSKPTKRSPSRKPPASSRRAAPARRDDDDLQPLDLEGTDFEELLGAGEPRGQDDLDDVDLDEDDDEDLDEDDEDGDGFADLRAPRTGGAASSEPSDLAARFGTYASSGEPVQPWTPEQPAADVEVDVDADGKRSDELIVGSLGLALVILTAAMPWYEIGVRQMTGLAAGSFGILPLVAGIGTIVTVVLKLAGKQLRFPVERGMMLEILGYLAVGGTVLARIFRPPGAVLIEPWGYPTLITMAAGIGLAWFASRLSHGAPLVLRPGWIKEAGGRAGAALLVLLVLLGGVLWLAKPFDSTPQARGVGDTLKYTQDPPSCFTENDFPLPPALIIDSKGFFRYDLGDNPVVDGDFCGVEFQSDLTVKKLRDKMRNQLKANGWKFEMSGAATGTPLIQLTAPACGSVSFFNQGTSKQVEHRTRGSVQIVPCARIGGTQPPQ